MSIDKKAAMPMETISEIPSEPVYDQFYAGVDEQLGKLFGLFGAKEMNGKQVKLSHFLHGHSSAKDMYEKITKNGAGEFGNIGDKTILYCWYDTPGRDYGKMVYSDQRINDLFDSCFESFEEFCIFWENRDSKCYRQKYPQFQEMGKLIQSYDILADISYGWWGF